MNKEDLTSLGSILVALGMVSSKELKKAIEEQESLNKDVLLGKILIASGSISHDDLQLALELQNGLRSNVKVKKANASAIIAKRSCASVIKLSRLVQNNSEEVRRNTGRAYKAISSGLQLSMKPKLP